VSNLESIRANNEAKLAELELAIGSLRQENSLMSEEMQKLKCSHETVSRNHPFGLN
jgi:hypothetical protein